MTSVPVVSPPEPPAPQTLVCANCGAALQGEYCAACGQRHEPHVHTLGHFAGEAFESLSHADSRLWRTLGYLLARPGFLTREFFAGRRVSYLPPFRLYLVISVVFFLLGMPEHVSVKPQPPGETLDSATLIEQAEQFESPDNPLPEAMRRQTAEYLRAEAARAATRETAARERAGAEPLARATDPVASGVAEEEERDNVHVSIGGLNDFCERFRGQAASGNAFRNSLRERCQRLASGDGESLGSAVVHNVPRAMFVFLPLLALLMKLMYWRPKRYYVEHLLFLIHNHAFIFLSASLLILLSRVPYSDVVMPWLFTAAGCYAVWYIYRAMRNVYGQGRGLTLAKYFALGSAYLVTSVAMLLLTVIYSALTL